MSAQTYMLSDEMMDELLVERREWLESFGREEKDVILGEYGDEVIAIEMEKGVVGEDDYSLERHEMPLPKQLTKENIFAKVDYSKPPF